MTEEQTIEESTPDVEPTPGEQIEQSAPEELLDAGEISVSGDEPGQAEESADESEEQESITTEVAEAETDKGQRVWWWPFIAYGLSWAALAAASYMLLTGVDAQTPAFRQEYYPYLVLAGLVLTLLGPLLAVMVWLVSWFQAGKGRRGGLFTRAIVRGATLTFLGVVLWVGCLVLVDALRLGLV